jgi:hypothetical protein
MQRSKAQHYKCREPKRSIAVKRERRIANAAKQNKTKNEAQHCKCCAAEALQLSKAISPKVNAAKQILKT